MLKNYLNISLKYEEGMKKVTENNVLHTKYAHK